MLAPRVLQGNIKHSLLGLVIPLAKVITFKGKTHQPSERTWRGEGVLFLFLSKFA